LSALRHLVSRGVEGAIIGTALYEGRFSLEEALSMTQFVTPPVTSLGTSQQRDSQ
jgi:hypothetical protein